MMSVPRHCIGLALIALCLLGCGGPSKDEICGDCEEGHELKKCRTSYDVCKLVTYCRVKSLKKMCD